jgi:hypothetical protein
MRKLRKTELGLNIMGAYYNPIGVGIGGVATMESLLLH